MERNLENKINEIGAGVLRFKTDMDKSFESTHLFQQLLRSATATPLNNAEVIGGETKRNFQHYPSILRANS